MQLERVNIQDPTQSEVWQDACSTPMAAHGWLLTGGETASMLKVIQPDQRVQWLRKAAWTLAEKQLRGRLKEKIRRPNSMISRCWCVTHWVGDGNTDNAPHRPGKIHPGGRKGPLGQHGYSHWNRDRALWMPHSMLGDGIWHLGP